MYFSFPRTCFLIFLVSFSLILGRTHAKPGVELRVNWPSYLAKHDLIWNKIPKGPRFNLEHKAHESTYHNRNSNCFFIDSIGIG